MWWDTHIIHKLELAYINSLGGTVSKDSIGFIYVHVRRVSAHAQLLTRLFLSEIISKFELVDLAKSLWMWCLERSIHIIAQHLPGVQNVVADAESRTMTDRSDWQLNPAIFNRITYLFGPIEMDLFSSRLTAQCPEFFSWWPDTQQMLLQDWSQISRVCQPTLESDRSGTAQSTNGQGSHCSGGTSLEDTTMVTPNCNTTSDQSRSR